MPQETADLKFQIQKTLLDINGITEKIKREVEMINEMVKDKGDLRAAVDEANGSLAKAAKVKGINTLDDLSSLHPLPDDFEGYDLLDVATVDLITQKLKSIMEV